MTSFMDVPFALERLAPSDNPEERQSLPAITSSFEDLMDSEVVKLFDGYFLFVLTLKFIFIAEAVRDGSGARMWTAAIAMIFLQHRADMTLLQSRSEPNQSDY